MLFLQPRGDCSKLWTGAGSAHMHVQKTPRPILQNLPVPVGANRNIKILVHESVKTEIPRRDADDGVQRRAHSQSLAEIARAAMRQNRDGGPFIFVRKDPSE